MAPGSKGDTEGGRCEWHLGLRGIKGGCEGISGTTTTRANTNSEALAAWRRQAARGASGEGWEPAGLGAAPRIAAAAEAARYQV
eukprot:scaffold8186_cov96-Isochrysis_galbana.AAC.1